MGSGSSTPSEKEIQEILRSNTFPDSITQCKPKGPYRITKEILDQSSNIRNILILTTGTPSNPSIWNTSNILVANLVLPCNIIPNFNYCISSYHSLLFFVFQVDQSSFYHIQFFMDKCRYFVQREELFNRILDSIDNYDDMLNLFIDPIYSKPMIEMPMIQFAKTTNKILEQYQEQVPESELESFFPEMDPINQSRISLSKRSELESSFATPILEPTDSSFVTDSDVSNTFIDISEPEMPAHMERFLKPNYQENESLLSDSPDNNNDFQLKTIDEEFNSDDLINKESQRNSVKPLFSDLDELITISDPMYDEKVAVDDFFKKPKRIRKKKSAVSSVSRKSGQRSSANISRRTEVDRDDSASLLDEDIPAEEIQTFDADPIDEMIKELEDQYSKSSLSKLRKKSHKGSSAGQDSGFMLSSTLDMESDPNKKKQKKSFISSYLKTSSKSKPKVKKKKQIGDLPTIDDELDSKPLRKTAIQEDGTVVPLRKRRHQKDAMSLQSLKSLVMKIPNDDTDFSKSTLQSTKLPKYRGDKSDTGSLASKKSKSKNISEESNNKSLKTMKSNKYDVDENEIDDTLRSNKYNKYNKYNVDNSDSTLKSNRYRVDESTDKSSVKSLRSRKSSKYHVDEDDGDKSLGSRSKYHVDETSSSKSRSMKTKGFKKYDVDDNLDDSLRSHIHSKRSSTDESSDTLRSKRKKILAESSGSKLASLGSKYDVKSQQEYPTEEQSIASQRNKVLSFKARQSPLDSLQSRFSHHYSATSDADESSLTTIQKTEHSKDSSYTGSLRSDFNTDDYTFSNYETDEKSIHSKRTHRMKDSSTSNSSLHTRNNGSSQSYDTNSYTMRTGNPSSSYYSTYTDYSAQSINSNVHNKGSFQSSEQSSLNSKRQFISNYDSDASRSSLNTHDEIHSTRSESTDITLVSVKNNIVQVSDEISNTFTLNSEAQEHQVSEDLDSLVSLQSEPELDPPSLDSLESIASIHFHIKKPKDQSSTEFSIQSQQHNDFESSAISSTAADQSLVSVREKKQALTTTSEIESLTEKPVICDESISTISSLESADFMKRSNKGRKQYEDTDYSSLFTEELHTVDNPLMKANRTEISSDSDSDIGTLESELLKHETVDSESALSTIKEKAFFNDGSSDSDSFMETLESVKDRKQRKDKSELSEQSSLSEITSSRHPLFDDAPSSTQSSNIETLASKRIGHKSQTTESTMSTLKEKFEDSISESEFESTLHSERDQKKFQSDISETSEITLKSYVNEVPEQKSISETSGTFGTLASNRFDHSISTASQPMSSLHEQKEYSSSDDDSIGSSIESRVIDNLVSEESTIDDSYLKSFVNPLSENPESVSESFAITIDSRRAAHVKTETSNASEMSSIHEKASLDSVSESATIDLQSAHKQEIKSETDSAFNDDLTSKINSLESIPEPASESFVETIRSRNNRQSSESTYAPMSSLTEKSQSDPSNDYVTESTINDLSSKIKNRPIYETEESTISEIQTQTNDLEYLQKPESVSETFQSTIHSVRQRHQSVTEDSMSSIHELNNEPSVSISESMTIESQKQNRFRETSDESTLKEINSENPFVLPHSRESSVSSEWVLTLDSKINNSNDNLSKFDTSSMNDLTSHINSESASTTEDYTLQSAVEKNKRQSETETSAMTIKSIAEDRILAESSNDDVTLNSEHVNNSSFVSEASSLESLSRVQKRKENSSGFELESESTKTFSTINSLSTQDSRKKGLSFSTVTDPSQVESVRSKAPLIPEEPPESSIFSLASVNSKNENSSQISQTQTVSSLMSVESYSESDSKPSSNSIVSDLHKENMRNINNAFATDSRSSDVSSTIGDLMTEMSESSNAYSMPSEHSLMTQVMDSNPPSASSDFEDMMKSEHIFAESSDPSEIESESLISTDLRKPYIVYHIEESSSDFSLASDSTSESSSLSEALTNSKSSLRTINNKYVVDSESETSNISEVKSLESNAPIRAVPVTSESTQRSLATSQHSVVDTLDSDIQSIASNVSSAKELPSESLEMPSDSSMSTKSSRKILDSSKGTTSNSIRSLKQKIRAIRSNTSSRRESLVSEQESMPKELQNAGNEESVSTNTLNSASKSEIIEPSKDTNGSLRTKDSSSSKTTSTTSESASLISKRLFAKPDSGSTALENSLRSERSTLEETLESPSTLVSDVSDTFKSPVRETSKSIKFRETPPSSPTISLMTEAASASEMASEFEQTLSSMISRYTKNMLSSPSKKSSSLRSSHESTIEVTLDESDLETLESATSKLESVESIRSMRSKSEDSERPLSLLSEESAMSLKSGVKAARRSASSSVKSIRSSHHSAGAYNDDSDSSDDIETLEGATEKLESGTTSRSLVTAKNSSSEKRETSTSASSVKTNHNHRIIQVSSKSSSLSLRSSHNSIITEDSASTIEEVKSAAKSSSSAKSVSHSSKSLRSNHERSSKKDFSEEEDDLDTLQSGYIPKFRVLQMNISSSDDEDSLHTTFGGDSDEYENDDDDDEIYTLTSEAPWMSKADKTAETTGSLRTNKELEDDVKEETMTLEEATELSMATMQNAKFSDESSIRSTLESDKVDKQTQESTTFTSSMNSPSVTYELASSSNIMDSIPSLQNSPISYSKSSENSLISNHQIKQRQVSEDDPETSSIRSSQDTVRTVSQSSSKSMLSAKEAKPSSSFIEEEPQAKSMRTVKRNRSSSESPISDPSSSDSRSLKSTAKKYYDVSEDSDRSLGSSRHSSRKTESSVSNGSVRTVRVVNVEDTSDDEDLSEPSIGSNKTRIHRSKLSVSSILPSLRSAASSRRDNEFSDSSVDRSIESDGIVAIYPTESSTGTLKSAAKPIQKGKHLSDRELYITSSEEIDTITRKKEESKTEKIEPIKPLPPVNSVVDMGSEQSAKTPTEDSIIEEQNVNDNAVQNAGAPEEEESSKSNDQSNTLQLNSIVEPPQSPMVSSSGIVNSLRSVPSSPHETPTSADDFTIRTAAEKQLSSDLIPSESRASNSIATVSRIQEANAPSDPSFSLSSDVKPMGQLPDGVDSDTVDNSIESEKIIAVANEIPNASEELHSAVEPMAEEKTSEPGSHETIISKRESNLDVDPPSATAAGISLPSFFVKKQEINDDDDQSMKSKSARGPKTSHINSESYGTLPSRRNLPRNNYEDDFDEDLNVGTLSDGEENDGFESDSD